MALTKLQFRPGVNKEITSYANEGGWVDSDKVRFRGGFPEKIGGWQSWSNNRFLGTCRAIFDWATLSGLRLIGLGTSSKYYAVRGDTFYDITPIDRTTAPGGVTFTATNGSSLLQVNHTTHAARVGDYVTFSAATGLGGLVTAGVINREYAVVEVLTGNTYRVQMTVTANGSDTGGGGAAVVAAYQVPVGSAAQTPTEGWGSGGWGLGTWGNGVVGTTTIRFWDHANYGEDLIYAPRGGALYYWDSSAGLAARGTKITGGDAPLAHSTFLVSDASRFVIALGCNPYLQSALDPMLVRWSDREAYNTWAPAITNQAGEYRLSNGSKIMCGRQSRQEILCWTDTALYAMKYVGAPYVFGFSLLASELSIISADAAVVVNGVAYWMGLDKFYKYDGRVVPLRCDLRKHIFTDINLQQAEQVFCGTNEAYNEIWWFYASSDSTTVNRYAVYNYVDDIWYHGSMQRTAWWDSALIGKPLAAYGTTLLQHETGVDDASELTPVPITAQIESAPVDIGDGDRASFVWRLLPDVTFVGASANNPAVNIELRPFRGSGAAVKSPQSVGGAADADVVRSASVPVEQYTEQVAIRVRGRQISMKLTSDQLGVTWQLGTPRVDLRPDGRRG